MHDLQGLFVLAVLSTAPLGCGGATGASIAVKESALTELWENETFDNLSVGSIAGQDGWQQWPGTPASVVFPGGPWGNYLKVRPNPEEGEYRVFPAQTSGQALFVFDWRPNMNVKDTTNVDIEVGQQFFFNSGKGLLLNNRMGTRVWVIPPSTANLGNWFWINCEFTLPNGPLSVSVNGTVLASGLPLPGLPLDELSIYGDTGPGAITLDNMMGITSH
jgi:hypothetical protein